jgi:hypothetical protein
VILKEAGYGAGMSQPQDDRTDREAAAPQLGPPTDVTLGDATMELLAYGDVAGAKARHDGTQDDGMQQVVPPKDTMQD